jgi:hypothetical protein
LATTTIGKLFILNTTVANSVARPKQQLKCFLGGPITGFITRLLIMKSFGSHQGPTIVGSGNGTPEVPELPSAWGYSWATLSPGVINTER